jgi:hypothetical protein
MSVSVRSAHDRRHKVANRIHSHWTPFGKGPFGIKPQWPPVRTSCERARFTMFNETHSTVSYPQYMVLRRTHCAIGHEARCVYRVMSRGNGVSKAMESHRLPHIQQMLLVDGAMGSYWYNPSTLASVHTWNTVRLPKLNAGQSNTCTTRSNTRGLVNG